jgi:two-component system, LytTR family, response regulator AlgR
MAEVRSLPTLIVDDEPLAVERLQIMCSKISAIDLVGTASDGAAALRMVAALAPRLLLLDMSMPGMDGLSVARALENITNKPAIVFVTAFDHFAVAAFDVAAVDYLLKPVAQDRLEKAVMRAQAILESPASISKTATLYTQEFWVPHRAEIVRVAAADIDLIEAERDYMRLHVGNRSFLLHETIMELERRLDPDIFIRLHRSTMVRRDRITQLTRDSLGGWHVELQGGKSCRIGRTYLASVRAMAGR